MEIKTKELTKILNLVIKQLEREQIDTISFENDLYLEIPYENFMQIDTEVENNDVGSLQDDWHILQTSLDNGQIIDNNDFNRIANILKAIGQQIEMLCIA
jgi:hypothetical protein